MSTAPELFASGSFAATVAANVRAETGRVGWKPIDLARALGVSHTWVSQRWTGRRQWQLEDIDAVANVLRVTPQMLCQQTHDGPAGEAGPLRGARSEGLEPPTCWTADIRALTRYVTWWIGSLQAVQDAWLAPVVQLASRRRSHERPVEPSRYAAVLSLPARRSS